MINVIFIYALTEIMKFSYAASYTISGIRIEVRVCQQVTVACVGCQSHDHFMNIATQLLCNAHIHTLLYIVHSNGGLMGKQWSTMNSKYSTY